MYNMNKYFIEYPKQRLFVCYDGKYSYLNLLINHCDNEYVFVQFVYGNIKICDAVRNLLKLRTKGDAWYLVTCMILDQFMKRLDKEEKGEFRYLILSEKDRDKCVRIEDCPCIYICTNDYYYDAYPGIMLFNRLKRNYL